uniref:Uncharacterized protein n=1 Tax=Arundo donax TaxID=35708 RepID=A0A0A9QSD4_ARUDO
MTKASVFVLLHFRLSLLWSNTWASLTYLNGT